MYFNNNKNFFHGIISHHFDNQKKKYEKCLSLISKLLGKSKTEIKYKLHPCASYNKDTLAELKELGIEIGFKQMMAFELEKGMKKVNNSFLEVARQDHFTIFKRMN